MSSLLLTAFRVVILLMLLLSGRVFAQASELKFWDATVPKFELRDAPMDEALRALTAKSRELDPTHAGINFVWPVPIPEDPHLDLRLVSVPLRVVVRYVARLAGLSISQEPHAVVFSREEAASAPAGNRLAAASQAAQAMRARQAVPGARPAAAIILPSVEFRDATVSTALEFLILRAREIDPARLGVNLLLDAPTEQREKQITLSLRNVPLGEALRYAASQADLVVLPETYAFVVTTQTPQPHRSRPPESTQATQPSPAPDLVPGIVIPATAPAPPSPSPEPHPPGN